MFDVKGLAAASAKILQRRVFFASFLLVLIVPGCTNDTTEHVVTLDEQSYRGVSKNGVTSFLGVRFAQAPVGELRWQLPQPPTSVSEIISADEFSPICMQSSYNVDWYNAVAQGFGVDSIDMVLPAVSEDCLFLNVWMPESSTQNKAIMIWVHGGNNVAGWSYEPNYIGQQLAKTGDVVVVSVNYRLGIFGFFDHPELEQPNLGLHDIAAAVALIKRNAKAFGADPNNITLFGESAGGANISSLLNYRAAREGGELFQRAIVQSAGFQLLKAETSAPVNELLPEDAKTLAELKALTAEEVLSIQLNELSDVEFYPVEREGENYWVKQRYQQDLLIGTNADEWLMYVPDTPGQRSAFNASISDETLAVVGELFAGIEDDRGYVDQATTFLQMRCPSYLMANHVDADHQAYVYQFNRVRAGGEKLGAYHGAEIPYVFGTHDDWLPTIEVDRDISAHMMRVWAEFAKQGIIAHSAYQRFQNDSPYVTVMDDAAYGTPIADYRSCEQLIGLYDVK